MTSPKFKLMAGIAGLLACTAFSSARAQTVYDTTYAWNGSQAVAPFGVPNTTTYGETFIAPGGPLNNFTFYVNPQGNILSMQADVFAWSGTLTGGAGPQGATGAALYTSPTSIVINGSTPANPAGFVPVTVNTGGVALTAGDAYVALLTMSDTADFNASTGTGVWGLVSGHVAGDGGGGFAFYNNGNNYAGLNTTAWDDFGDFGDSAWTANFGAASSVPEPGTFAMFGGVCMAGFAALRRRNRAQK